VKKEGMLVSSILDRNYNSAAFSPSNSDISLNT